MAKAKSHRTYRKPSGRKVGSRTGSRKKRRKSTFRLPAVKLPTVKVGPVAVGVAAAVLLLLVLVPHLRRHSRDNGAAVPEGSFSYMMDVSHHQKDIVWDSLLVMTDGRGRTVRDASKATRIRNLDYVVMKAAEGENWRDDRFQEYWEASAAAGLRRGAYLFFLPSRNPEKQARNFIGAVPELRYKDLAPILDVETKPDRWTSERFDAAVLRCLDVLEAHYGRKPIIYAPDSFVTDIFDDKLRSYPIWVAHYETEKPAAESWRYWQFTDKAVVFGVDGKVDLSVIR